MADPISAASAIITLVTFGIKSSSTLYQTFKEFNSHHKHVKELKAELDALGLVLVSLHQAILDNEADFTILKLPLFRCGSACVEFNMVVKDATKQFHSSLASFRDWAKLKYLGDDIEGFKALTTAKEACAKNCIIEGISDYSTVGVFTKGSDLRLDMYNPSGGFASPRVYLLSKDEMNYEMLKLNGNELTFDVDISKLPCGMNGALYLSEMRADGGRSKLNPKGAAYGTGYCDAQCFVTPWMNGEGNIEKQGVCCNEMDIWEANSRSTSIAPHTCSKPSLFGCTGDECGKTGLCDKNGCVDNPYKTRGDKAYYGLHLKVDTTRPFTVVTQFPAKNGELQAIVRKYIQDGIVLDNATKNITMDQAYCSAQGGAEMYNQLGGHKGMGHALSRGMVLAMSVWWDESGAMQWLDSGASGPCNATEGFPAEIVKKVKNPTVTFRNIKWGEIGSTFSEKKAAEKRWKA